MLAEKRIHTEALVRMRREISEAEGREVLFVGRIDSEGTVTKVVTSARGDEVSVPALAPHMEKGDVVLHNHPSGRLHPSKADLGIASYLGSQGIGFFIVDSEVLKVYVVAEPVLLKKPEPLDEDFLAALLEPGGALEASMPGYEPRPPQVDLLRSIVRTFERGGICIAEAGTGVGKSLAYLIPALASASENDERIVVSTATINLQEQLLDKDIPLVKKLLGKDIPSVLVKGRGNYLCLSRLSEALEEKSLFEEDNDALEALARWAEETPTGSRSDLSFFPGESVWSSVCSEADTCTGLRCATREKCFLLKARREAAAAKVLVVNHHLLFSDLALRVKGAGFENTAVLPPFNRIIFDEAHNIENSATSFFSEALSRPSILRSLNRLLQAKGRKRAGLIPRISQLSADSAKIEGLPSLVHGVREQAVLLDVSSLPALAEANTFRLTVERAEIVEKTFGPALWELQRRVLGLAEALGDLIDALPDEEAEKPEVYETRMIVRRLEGFAGVAEQFRGFDEHPERVLWIEKKRTSQGDAYLQFNSTPLDITRMMREAVYEPFASLVFTSATLTVGRSFRFWKSRVGLPLFEEAEVSEGIFDSPFDYKHRVMIGIPTDSPLPESPLYQEYLSKFLADVLQVSEGRALVLFTSYDMLMKTYAAVKPVMDDSGISVYRQGDDERSRLLRRFNEDLSSVLFATDSFWEGVDSPGQTLEVVVLCRLPFKVPTDPVLVARMEAIRQRGGNPFIDLSLPEAVMKFKQGFGRLMRRTTDRGAVLIPDGRIVAKSYGKIFLSSLPETRRSVKSTGSLIFDLENFLADR